MKKHIIFDVDDTLTNSYELNQQLFVDTFTAHVPDVDQNYLRELHYFSRGTAMRLQFETAVKHLNLQLEPSELVRENELIHTQNVDKLTMFEDVYPFFEQLKAAGKIISVCTNRQYGSFNKILEQYGIRRFLDNAVSCSDEGFEKPDPTCLLNVIEKSGVSKEDCMYFGDSKTDSEFASNAGIDYMIIDHYLNQKKFYKLILQMLVK